MTTTTNAQVSDPPPKKTHQKGIQRIFIKHIENEEQNLTPSHLELTVNTLSLRSSNYVLFWFAF